MFQNSASKRNVFLLLLKGIKKMSFQYNAYLFLYRKSRSRDRKQQLFKLLESKSKFIHLVFETFQEYYSLIQLWNIEMYFRRIKKDIFRNLTGMQNVEYDLNMDFVDVEKSNLSFLRDMLRKISEPSFRNLFLRHQFELKSILATV
ncbi:MAG: hypothetical protein CMB97_13835 [Flavobacteriaceae bacterium]|nr:hypothetical protein [Flavobacteriaceae bacterium]